MASSDLRIVLTFSPEDQTWLRLSSVAIPDFFSGHGVVPASGDALRIGGRQFMVQARVWEHDGMRPVLRLLMGDSQAASDTVFG